MATVKEWSNAYALQAKADFMTYQALESLRSEAVVGWSIPICHKLQFLQMACEKLETTSLHARHRPGVAPGEPCIHFQGPACRYPPRDGRGEFQGKEREESSYVAGHIAQEIRCLRRLSGVRASGQITANTRGRMRTNASTSLSRGRSLQLN